MAMAQLAGRDAQGLDLAAEDEDGEPVVHPDVGKAVALLERAAQAGHAESSRDLDRLRGSVVAGAASARPPAPREKAPRR